MLRHALRHAAARSPRLVGAALASGAGLVVADCGASSAGAASSFFAGCESAAAAPDPAARPAYPTPPAKLDDPQENAKIMTSWRAHIQQARELWMKHDLPGAEQELKQALEEAAHFGQSSGPVATSLLNLAQLYRRSGRLAEAEPLLVRAADVLEQTAGPNNKVTLMAMLDLASVKFERGEASQAMQVYEDTLGRLDAAEANQPHGRAVLREVRAGCLLNSARAAVRAGELARAEASLRESLAIAEEKWGPTSPRVLAPCAELARVLSRLGREEESGALLARARALPDLKPVQLHQIEALAAELKGPPKPK